MSGYIFGHLGGVRCDAEGVGSYGSAATPATVFETAKESAGIAHVPTREMIDTLTPYRGGQTLETVDKTTDAAYISRLRAATLAGADTVKPSLHHALRGAGWLQAYDAGPPYTLTYTLQDVPEAMDSVTVRDQHTGGSGANGIQKLLDGVRWNLKISAEKGKVVVFDFAGKGQSYTFADIGGAPTNDATPTGRVIKLIGATVTVETIGGGTSYSGPIEAFEVDFMMNPVEIKTGTTTSLVDEVQLQPSENFPFSITLAEKLIATWNAEKLRDDEEDIHVQIVISDPGDANNTWALDLYGGIESVEKAQLNGTNARGQKMNFRSIWYHASAPGVTPAKSAVMTWSTTP